MRIGWPRADRRGRLRRDRAARRVLPAGRLAARHGRHLLHQRQPDRAPLLNIVTLNLAVIAAAIIGDTRRLLDRRQGRAGRSSRARSRCSSRRSTCFATKEFYERHGGKTIIIARFMPYRPHVRARRRRRRQDELPPLRHLQRLRRHRLGAEHDDARLHAGQEVTRRSPSGSTRSSSSSSSCRCCPAPSAGSSTAGRARRRPRRSPCDDGEAKAPVAEKPRPAPKVAFPKKASRRPRRVRGAPPRTGRQALRVLRTFLKKQGAAEDFYLLRPRTAGGYRHMKDEQSICSIVLSAGRLVGIVALDSAAQARLPGTALSDVGRRAPQAGARNAGAAVARRPLDGAGANDFKMLLKAKLVARVGLKTGATGPTAGRILADVDAIFRAAGQRCVWSYVRVLRWPSQSRLALWSLAAVCGLATAGPRPCRMNAGRRSTRATGEKALAASRPSGRARGRSTTPGGRRAGHEGTACRHGSRGCFAGRRGGPRGARVRSRREGHQDDHRCARRVGDAGVPGRAVRARARRPSAAHVRAEAVASLGLVRRPTEQTMNAGAPT